MERRAPAQGSSRDQCIQGPSSGTTLTQFYSNSTNTFIMSLLQVLCAQYAGITHHRVLQTSGWGWADSTLLEVPLSRGCCLKYTVLPVQGGVLNLLDRVLTTKSQQQTTDRPQVLCPGGIYSW